MAMSPSPSGGKGGYRPLSEINVTPLVDVMLVLLIIFMVAAPLMSVAVPVDLPKTDAAKLTPPKDPLVISIDKQGALFLKDEPVSDETLTERLAQIPPEEKNGTAFVRADHAIDYGRVVDIMARLGKAGFAKVSLMADLPTQSAPAAAP